MTEHISFKMEPPGEPVEGKTYRADGWAYRDFFGAWFTEAEWTEILKMLGQEGKDYVILSFSKRMIGDDVQMRGQILISPNMRAM
jgi:hypothetical protein